MNQANALLVEGTKSAISTVPKDITGAAQSGAWINLYTGRRLLYSILQGAWAGGTPAVTFEQASDSSGTGAKALTPGNAFYYQSTTSTNTITRTAIASGTFNLPNQANTLTQVEIAAEDLDVANGFSYVRLKVASPGSNADLLAVLATAYQLDQVGNPTTLPSVIA